MCSTSLIVEDGNKWSECALGLCVQLLAWDTRSSPEEGGHCWECLCGDMQMAHLDFLEEQKE